MPSFTRVTGRTDPGLKAVLTGLRAMSYAGGASAANDLPAHVRAASAIRRFGSRALVVQDDINALAVVGRAGASRAKPILLLRGKHGRRTFDKRNKKHKMDLEACAALPDGRLVVFGSGSKRRRESIVVVDAAHRARVFDGAKLYAALRAERRFSGSELNLEGALVRDGELLLFQRGNGRRKRGREPVNAVGTLGLASFLRWLAGRGPVPRLQAIVQLDLGKLGGCALSTTDAALLPDGTIAISACAEDSPDAIEDGPVAGCRLGLLRDGELTLTDVVDETGRLARHKIEGLEARGAGVFEVVVDADDANTPALIGRLTTTRRRARAAR